MLFAKRRWATEVAGAAGLEAASNTGRVVITLLVIGAKQAHRMVRGEGPRGSVDDLDLVMMAARALPDTPAAAARLEKTLSISLGETERLLSEVAAAAVRFYLAQGRDLSAPRPPRAREPWSPPRKTFPKIGA
jgi:tRNA pseudouridine-54 N-methylase